MFSNLAAIGSFDYLSYGITLGLAAGIAPGPLLALVISETLKGNRKNGVLIAIAPLITDLPIVIVSIYLLHFFLDSEFILGLLSIMGGLFLVYIGIQNLRFNQVGSKIDSSYGRSIMYGVNANAFSPHPYVFWLTIGAPTYLKATEQNSFSSLSFIGGFYVFLIGSKIIVAFISDRIKGFLQSKAYKIIMRSMGMILLVVAFLLLYEGIGML